MEAVLLETHSNETALIQPAVKEDAYGIYLGHVLYIIITEIHNLTWGIDIHVKSKAVFLKILLFWQLLNVWYQNDSCRSQT